MITVPPPDPEYNAKIEGHPNYKLACTLSNIITAAGAGAFIIPVAIQFVPMVKSFVPWLLPTIAFIIIGGGL